MTAEQKPKVEEVVERMKTEIKELRANHKKIKNDLAKNNWFADRLKESGVWPKKSQAEA